MIHRSVIAIIIPVHNRLKLTIQGLSCIKDSINHYYQHAEDSHNIQVIVVDDGSTDGSGEWIRLNHPDIIVLNGDGNLWWTGAVNMGIEYFQKNFTDQHAVILQNDDIYIENDWLLNLVNCAATHNNALIGCATATMDSKDLLYYGGITVHSWLSMSKIINRGVKRSNFPKGHVQESFDLYGRGLFLPMEVFRSTGLFNKKRFKHRGDMDIPLRAKKLGYKLLVSYDAVVYQFPEHTFDLDTKKNISVREMFKILTDFRSSYNITLTYYYSKVATKNWFQFIVFFSFRAAFSVKGILQRYFKSKLAFSNFIC